MNTLPLLEVHAELTTSHSLKSGKEVVLKRAFLEYEKHDYLRGHLHIVTEHPVEHHPDGTLSLAAGSVVTEENIKGLLERTLQSTPLVFLPEEILAFNGERLVWWEAAQMRTLFFNTKKPAVDQHSGKSFIQPPLVFVADSKSLSVFALTENQRPNPQTPLFLAPYMNMGAGHICLGTTRRPKHPTPGVAGEYSLGFFASEFTHVGAGRKLLRKSRNYGRFLQRLEKMTVFPTQELIPGNLTLQQVLK